MLDKRIVEKTIGGHFFQDSYGNEKMQGGRTFELPAYKYREKGINTVKLDKEKK